MAKFNDNDVFTVIKTDTLNAEANPSDTATEELKKFKLDGTTYSVLNKDDLLNLVYPVGSIYMSVNSVSPATLFGGTWEQLKDKFLLGAGDTYSLGTTGGSATHSHTLDSAYVQMRNVAGNYLNNIKDVDETWTPRWQLNINSETPTNVSQNAGIPLGGTTDNGSSLPPYLVVCMWKRTA